VTAASLLGSKSPQHSFARQLKAWRADRGLTQREAAEVLEVPHATLRNWEIARVSPRSTLRLMLERQMKG
jgi:DNA-binding transcriptional regulator YiaG